MDDTLEIVYGPPPADRECLNADEDECLGQSLFAAE